MLNLIIKKDLILSIKGFSSSDGKKELVHSSYHNYLRSFSTKRTLHLNTYTECKSVIQEQHGEN